MLRFLVGYLFGTGIGFLLGIAFVQLSIANTINTFIFFASFWIIMLVVGLFWSYSHHIKKQKDYYKKVNS